MTNPNSLEALGLTKVFGQPPAPPANPPKQSTLGRVVRAIANVLYVALFGVLLVPSLALGFAARMVVLGWLVGQGLADPAYTSVTACVRDSFDSQYVEHDPGMVDFSDD